MSNRTIDFEVDEDNLSLYEKEVDCNERFYKFYMLNIEMLKKIIEQVQRNYDSTDDPRIKEGPVNLR